MGTQVGGSCPVICAVSVLEMNRLHLQNESLTDFAWSLLERIFPERQDQQEDLNESGNVFCYPYQLPCAIRQEVPPATVLPLFTTDGQRTGKQIPIDNLLSRAAGNSQCLGLVQAA